MQKADYIAEAIEAHYGPRCPDFNAECACCLAWERYNALSAQDTGAPGWVLVPLQATPEMEDAAVKRVKPYHDLESWRRHIPGDLFRLAWPAMIAAAPPHTEGK